LKKVEVPIGAESDASKHLEADFAVGWTDSVFSKPPQFGMAEEPFLTAIALTVFKGK
jgi:hypothetical protein